MLHDSLMKKANKRIAVIVVLLLSAMGAEGDSTHKENALNILFIGNSYTGNLRGMFNRFMEQASPESHISYQTPGGWTLARHAENEGVKQAIDSRKWDYVVLQEQSRTPTFSVESSAYQAHRAAIRQLTEWIREAGATPVLYETWGRRDGDKGARKRSPDFDAMQAHLTRAYADAGQETDAIVVPVGQVWQAVRHADLELGRSLHAPDGSHASKKGSYLIAATFLKALVKVDAATLAHPKNLSDKETAIINRAIDQVLNR